MSGVKARRAVLALIAAVLFLVDRMARAWQARERTPEVRALLIEICQRFGTDDENVDLAEARTLLEQLAVSTGRQQKSRERRAAS